MNGSTEIDVNEIKSRIVTARKIVGVKYSDNGGHLGEEPSK